MTKTIRLIVRTILASSFLLTGMLTHGQTSWDIIGNSGTNPTTNFIGTTDNKALRIRTNNSVRMTVNSNGKIGIGTTSPAAVLDLTKNGTTDLNVKSNNGHAKIIIDRGSTDSTALLEYRTLGGSGFGNTWQMGTTKEIDGDFIINCIGTNDTAMRIVKSTGNIGIGGRASGSVKLYVEGAAEMTGQLKTAGVEVVGVLKVAGGAGVPAAGKVFTCQDANGNGAWETPTGGISGAGVASRVTFWNGASSLSSNANLFWDNANSRLGIGTASPSTQLEINGQIKITGGTPGTGQVLTCDANGLATWETPTTGGLSGSGAGSRVTFWSGANVITSSSGFVYDPSNIRLGIGTGSPNVPLHVTGGTDASPSSGTGYMVIGNITTTNVVFDDNEILARNNGVVSTLSLNANGGNVIINGSGSGMVGIGTNGPSFQLELSTNSAAKPTSSAWTVSSDARLKKDVSDFNDGLNIIKKIHPVWFNYNGKAGMPLEERGVGTIAQEIQKIAPYMIKEWIYEDENHEKEKYLGVDYGAMDFVLINAIKEQQQQIDSKNEMITKQQKDIEELKVKFISLENAMSQCCTSYESTLSERQSVTEDTERAKLEQNIPNPFSEKTIIKFYIPQNAFNARIKIYGLDGPELKSIPVTSKGFGQTEISGKTLSPGTYTYMLLIDGKVVDTKQMVLTK